MPSCIFCDIVSGKVPSFKIYEDDSYIGALDKFPNTKGQSLVMPKRHHGSYLFDLDDQTISECILAAKRVAKVLERGLDVGRVHVVFEGTGVNHLHAKLYPAIGTTKTFEEKIAEGRVFFYTYPGYVSTLLGPVADDETLKKLQADILGKSATGKR
ncbi:MAG: HIT domain-containing protein [Candidatus Marsarchaeota archaeon]|nr:HIT domain-containing protein [Candidatus Marsarchaeota archaeon]